MTTPTTGPTTGPLTTAAWPPGFGPDFRGNVIHAILSGAAWARSLTPLPTDRTSVAFPLVTDLDEPGWVEELGEIPSLGGSWEVYEVAASKLARTIIVSKESIDDASFPVSRQLVQTLQDTFSGKLDRDLINGEGPAPIPTGILSVAGEVTGADWELAAINAKVQIANSSGAATHIAVSPTVFGQIESSRDANGTPLYPAATERFAGLTTVIAPAATQPIVYDANRLYLVIRKDFVADTSEETDEAWRHYALSIRVVGRFAVAAPMPERSVRKLAIAEPETRPARAETRGGGGEPRRRATIE